MNSQEMVIEV